MGRDQARSQILQAAGAIFASKGFANATIRRICAGANVNVAAVNYYFGDKEGLYRAALQQAREMIETRWPMPTWSSESSPEDRLKAFIHTLCRRLFSPHGDEWQTRLLLREIVEPTDVGEALVRQGFQPLFQSLLQILRPMLPADLAQGRVQQIGFSIVGQCLFYLVHQRAVRLTVTQQDRADYFSPDALADHVFEFSLGALQNFGTPSPLAGSREEHGRSQIGVPNYHGPANVRQDAK